MRVSPSADRQPGERLLVRLAHRLHALRLEASEVEVPGVRQVRRLDVAQRREDRLGAPGELALPGREHVLDRNALQVVLRAAQAAGDEREGAAARIALDVALGDIGERT